MIRKLRDFRTSQDGNATMEFVIVFPLLMFLVMAMAEIGWLTTRNVLLERGLDMATRDLRLGLDPNMDHAALKARVCEQSSILINCDRDLVLEVVEMDLASAYPQNQANCIDRTGEIDPKISFTTGGRSEIMFIRACMVIDPIFPGVGVGLGLPKDSSGGYQMVAYTAFMNEPA